MGADTSRQAAFWRAIGELHPPLLEAVAADARITARRRGDRFEFRSRPDLALQVLRLAVTSDAFGAQCCYRAKAAAQARGIPVLPRLLHRLAIVLGQIAIGDPVVVAPGVYLPHGQVVVDGYVRVGAGTVIAPFVTIGLVEGGMEGPTIGAGVNIGTGACILGQVSIGDGATIGAGAVVLDDVPPGATAVGVPARVLD
jgi:serine O-acetyltransferase